MGCGAPGSLNGSSGFGSLLEQVMLQRCGSLFASFSCVDFELCVGRGEAADPRFPLVWWQVGSKEMVRVLGPKGRVYMEAHV